MVLSDRLTCEQRLEIRIAAMRDSRDPRYRLVGSGRVIAGIFAERPFRHGAAQIDLELDDDLGRGWYFEIDRPASDKFHGRTTQAASHVPVVRLIAGLYLAGIGE